MTISTLMRVASACGAFAIGTVATYLDGALFGSHFWLTLISIFFGWTFGIIAAFVTMDKFPLPRKVESLTMRAPSNGGQAS